MPHCGTYENTHYITYKHVQKIEMNKTTTCAHSIQIVNACANQISSMNVMEMNASKIEHEKNKSASKDAHKNKWKSVPCAIHFYSIHGWNYQHFATNEN